MIGASRAAGAVNRPLLAVANRLVLTGISLAVGALVMSLSPGTITRAVARVSTSTTPGIGTVTVTVPGQTVTTPPVSSTPVTTAPPPATAPTRTPPVTSTQSISTPTAASPVSAGSHPTATLAPSEAAAVAARRHLRSIVVGLSRCVSTLPLTRQRLLMLRAGIVTARSTSARSVARTLRISVTREGRLEHTAVSQLQTAARTDSCGPIPAWIHVPADHRLVSVDPVFVARVGSG